MILGLHSRALFPASLHGKRAACFRHRHKSEGCSSPKANGAGGRARQILIGILVEVGQVLRAQAAARGDVGWVKAQSLIEEELVKVDNHALWWRGVSLG